MTIRTRFAPSPTGYLHIGNVRTALFNYLLARHYGGDFLLRIEDTDRARHNEDAVDVILNGLKWLGLDWDEAPLRQHAQIERHKQAAQELIENGKAYKCYLSQEELEELRTKARETGTCIISPWRDADPSTAPSDREPVIRLRSEQDGATTVSDLVQGDVTVANDQIDDIVLLRSDGTPTYMLSVVVDDHDMKITHVVRGDDHLTNTFRQIQIYKAFGWDIPKFAHLPMILGNDGAKLSKRHGALGLHEYIDMGYLPEALCNYLMRLGWSHGDEEIISMKQAISWFDFDGINKSAGRFDFDKLNHLNSHYIKETDDETLTEMLIPLIEKELKLRVSDQSKIWLVKGMSGLKDRGNTLPEIAEQALFYAQPRPLSIQANAASILEAEDAAKNLAGLIDVFNQIEDFTADNIQENIKEFVNNEGLKFKDVGMPLRVALTGTKSSPATNEIAEALGREETIKRLEDVVMKQNKILSEAV